MELYRFTGAVAGLIFSGGISLFFYFCSRSAEAGNYMGSMAIIYMLIPSMVLFGFLFDCKFVWKSLMRLSVRFRPSHIGSGVFWLAAWPLCKLLSDVLAGVYFFYAKGQFLMPSYLKSWGLDGVFGFFFFQAIVGSGMGLVYYMIYGPVFSAISRVRVWLGMGDSDFELSLKQEMAEFGFRK